MLNLSLNNIISNFVLFICWKYFKWNILISNLVNSFTDLYLSSNDSKIKLSNFCVEKLFNLISSFVFSILSSELCVIFEYLVLYLNLFAIKGNDVINTGVLLVLLVLLLILIFSLSVKYVEFFFFSLFVTITVLCILFFLFVFSSNFISLKISVFDKFLLLFIFISEKKLLTLLFLKLSNLLWTLNTFVVFNLSSINFSLFLL